jgi:hypothetical protein
MSLLTDEEVARTLVDSPWERDGDAIARALEFGTSPPERGITRADLDVARTLDGVG